MRKSKKIIVRIVQEFSKKFLNNTIYSLILFLRCFNKFKRAINREKKFTKYCKNLDKINDHEYKITSQNNEDGIIEYIFSKIPNNKNFIEIGVGYYEFNSLNLIRKGWTGILIEQNFEECLVIKKLLSFFFPKANVAIIKQSVNKNNINQIISDNKKNDEIDFFSLDIDGNDYWVLKNTELDNIKCICLEYNHWIGNNVKKTIPYDEDFEFIDNGFFGASLLAFSELLKNRNFELVAIESSGTNAFFVNKKYSHLFDILDPIRSFKSAPRLYSEDRQKEIFAKINNYNFTDV